jgi:phosphate transport system permease protein
MGSIWSTLRGDEAKGSAMSAAASPPVPYRSRAAAARSRRRHRSIDRLGDGVLYGLCALASLLAVTVLLLIGYKVVNGAGPAISKFGLGFLTSSTWQPNFGQLGAASLLFGTAVTSAVALVLATPIAIAIALFLSLLAPTGVGRVISPLV